MRLLIAAALITVASSCRSPDDAADDVPVFRNVDAAYVGDAVCFDCHTDAWQGFKEHGMAQSWYLMTSENAVEDFSAAPLLHKNSGFWYRVFEDDGAFYQEEYRLGANGNKTHRLVRRMDYVVGSGFAARTYLTQSGERLYEMPLTWYSQGQMWDFSPGYVPHNKRFDRLVPDRCVACHNSYPESVEHVEGKYTEVPLGISCERCHGPAELHVAERLSSPDPTGPIDDTIVNPAHLDRERQLDVCQQCHLHTTVSLLRDGRGPFDFRPSERLEDHLALYYEEAPQTEGAIGVISHADRMKQSECYVATPSLTCITCHDPHKGFRDLGPSYFNETCLSCHTPASVTFLSDDRLAHSDTTNCISCHMPRIEAEDAPHSSFTDHWIRVVRDDLPPPEQSHDLRPYFARDSVSRHYEGLAYIVLGTQRADTKSMDRGVILLKDVLASDADTTGEAHFLLGLTEWRLGRSEAAIAPLERAVELGPDIPERLNALAQAYETAGLNPEAAIQLYEQALAAQPQLADIRLNYGRLLETLGRLDDAAEQYGLAAAEKPWLATAHYNLGTALLQQGAIDDAENSLRAALELEPDHPRALGNLGTLLASRGEPQSAYLYFARAVEIAPENSTALSNLGTWHLDRDELDRAVEYLAQAVASDPSFLEAVAKLALAHFRNDDFEQARIWADRALEIDPQNALARQILYAL